ncbi:hypothetical protein B0H14DRAFT_3480369 [Mycena olivaceomarginata]|nr:hypothetical protein B0H14DRAFT_3480369 [Mycena olivaceomarginata]
MKRVGSSQLPKTSANISRFATNVPSAKVTFHTGATVKSQRRYVGNGGLPQAPILLTPVRDEPNEPTEPNLPFSDATEEAPGAIPAYETTPACNEKGDAAKAEEICQTVAHMKELKDEEPSVPAHPHVPPLQLPTQRTLFVRAAETDGRVSGLPPGRAALPPVLGKEAPNDCPHIGPWNGIHATAIAFCGCKTVTAADGRKVAALALRAAAGGGTTGKQRSQGKGSAYNFVLVLQRLADPNFANRVPDIYKNFLAITRFYENIQIIIESGEGHGLDIPLAGEVGRPYPNRPKGFLGLVCAACPEPGVNMPLLVHVPPYLQASTGITRLVLFFKRDNGRDTGLDWTGICTLTKQAEFELFLKTYVIPEEDKEVPLVSSAAPATMPFWGGNIADLFFATSFALGTYAQWEHLRHKNTPPLSAESQVPMVQSYDSYCSFVVNQTKRGGQIPADHIRGHGIDCQALWQAIYFACWAHFHGETAEVIWAFLNGLGSSTRQMTGGSRHDIINFVMHAWNLIKHLRHAELLAAKRLDALQLFELHMAVVEELDWQHATEVGVWSRMSRLATKDSSGKPCSVYQHKSTKALTVESTLAAMITVEQEKLKRDGQHEAGTSVAQWIHDGMAIERQQALAIALLRSHREHPLQETWDSITRLRDSLNHQLKKFRQHHTDGDDQRPAAMMTKPESELRDAEIELRCTEAQSAILAVRDASLALSAVRKARDLDFRGQVGITRSKRNLQKAELMKTFEIGMYNSSRDSRLFDGTAWYLQSGMTITNTATTSILSPRKGSLLAGTQSRKRTSFKRDPRTPKHLRDIAPEGVGVESSAEESGAEMSPSKGGKAPEGKKGKTKERGKKKPDGWIWMESLMWGQHQSEEKLAAYKKESDQVQWFQAEAEMYRWLEQYEQKHTEFLRVIERYRRDGKVWVGLAEHKEGLNGVNGTSTYARMEAAMRRRLAHNAEVIFKSANSGAHHDWVSATSFDEMVGKIDKWRDKVFKWMDDLGVHRAYKDFK